ncbi:MAG: type IV pilus assembly protein PilM [Candidatus Omnitrophota bacterium]
MKFFSSQPQVKVGLDIGTHSVKMVKLQVENEALRLTGVGSIQPKDVTDQGMADAIKALSKQLNLNTKNVAVSVSGTQVIVRFITIPKMKESDIRGALQFEAEKYIPFNVNDVIIEYQTLNVKDQGKKLDLVIACAKKDYVLKKVSLAESADLVVDVVDVDGFSVMNSFLKNNADPERKGSIVLVNIGANMTNVVVLDGNTLRFSRDIHFGGKIIDSAISKRFGLDMIRAEEVRLDPKEKAAEAAECVHESMLSLFGELRLSLGYFDNQFGRAVSEVYISGGLAEASGIEKMFEENIGIKTAAWDPLKFLLIDNSSIDQKTAAKIGKSLAVAVGLALR